MHVFCIKMDLYKTVIVSRACWCPGLLQAVTFPPHMPPRAALVCQVWFITSTSSDCGGGLRVGPGQSPGPGLCDMTLTWLLSSPLCGLSQGTPLWGDRTVTGFPGVGVAGLLTGLHRCTLFAPTISLLQVYLQDIVKDGSEVLAIWIALPIFSQFHSGPGFRKEDQMGSNTMKGQKETEGNVMIRNIRNTRNSKKHGLWQLVMWHP